MFFVCFLTEEDKGRGGVTREKGEEMKTEIERKVERESVHETHVWGVQGHTHTHTVHSKHKVVPSIRMQAGTGCLIGEKRRN